MPRWRPGTRVATHWPTEVSVPTSQSLQTIPSRPSEKRSASNRPSTTRRAFDTMENLFFREGDELSNPVAEAMDPEEVTELVPRPKNRRKLALWIASGAVVLVVGLAVLIF